MMNASSTAVRQFAATMASTASAPRWERACDRSAALKGAESVCAGEPGKHHGEGKLAGSHEAVGESLTMLLGQLILARVPHQISADAAIVKDQQTLEALMER
jgi:hypothetical protein